MIEVVFSSRVSLLAFYSSEKVLSAQVCPLACIYSIGPLTKDKDEAGSAKVNVSGHVKKATVTTNNRIQAGFHSSRRQKARQWTQNQLTNRRTIIRKIQTYLEMFKTFYSTSD